MRRIESMYSMHTIGVKNNRVLYNYLTMREDEKK